MNEDLNPITPKLYNTQTSLALLILTVAAGFVLIGPALGLILAAPFFPGSITELSISLQKMASGGPSDPDLKIPLYIIQGSATFVGFIAGPLLLWKILHKEVYALFRFTRNELLPASMIPVVILASMGIIALSAELNEQFHFPDSWNGFESWARESEDMRAEQTKMLTQFNTIGELLLSLLVIAILPGIGEELVFRGFIQKQLTVAKVNPHLSIWLTAALFSAIHLQFFGFLPRVLLGALFGYLFFWSNNLLIPILAHIFTNGAQVVAAYIFQQDDPTFDINENPDIPIPYILLSLVVLIVLLLYYRRFYKFIQTDSPGH